MTRIAFVVSRNHLELVPGLRRGLPAGDVEVIVDRRQTQRRQRSEPTDFPDRRHSERRVRSNSCELELIGIAAEMRP